MKSTNMKALSAYFILQRMGQKQIPTPVAYKLYKLRQKLKEILEFVREQEQAMMDEMGVKMDEAGHFQFGEDEEVKARFTAAHDELLNTECEIEGEETAIRLADLPDKLEISMNEIEALDGFVRFE